MIGKIISCYPFEGKHIVSFSMLGMQDYGATIRPWADRNLRHAIRFVASSSVVVADEDLPLFMLRW